MRCFKQVWYIVILLAGVVFTVVIQLAAHQEFILKEKQRVNRHLYLPESICFEADIQNKRVFNEAFLEKLEGKALFQEDYGDNTVRRVIASNSYEAPSLIWGRFFNEEDATGNVHTAILGKSAARQARPENGELFYSYGDTSYMVIGVLDYSEQSEAGNLVLLSANIENIEKGLFVLDNCNSQEFSVFCQEQEDIFHNINIMERLDINPALQSSGPQMLIYFFSLLCIDYSLVILYCNKSNHLEFNLRRMLGQQSLKIVLTFLVKELVFSFIGILLGSIIVYFFMIFKLDIWRILILQITVMLFLVCIWNLLFYLLEKKSSISDKVR